MANGINWGRIYCFTEFGYEDRTIAESVPSYSSPSCFTLSKVAGQIETLAFTVDDIINTVDSLLLTADQELITL